MEMLFLNDSLALAAARLCAQGAPNLGVGEFTPDRGFLPFGSHSLSETESINEATGGLVLTVPMAKLPPGRGGFSMGIDLTYNSQAYDLRTVQASGSNVYNYCQNQQYNCPALVNALVPSLLGGWRYSYNYALEVEFRQLPSPWNTCQLNIPETSYLTRVSLVLPDGSSHALRLRGVTDNNGDEYYQYSTDGNATCTNLDISPASIGSVLQYYTTDGSFLQVTVDNRASGGPIWTAVLPDGTTVSGKGVNGSTTLDLPILHPANRVCDRNNNCVAIQNSTVTGSGYPTTVLTDDQGRSIQVIYNTSSCTLQPDQWPNCSATTDTVRQPAYKGGNLDWTVNWTSALVAPGTTPVAYNPKKSSTPRA